MARVSNGCKHIVENENWYLKWLAYIAVAVVIVGLFHGK